MSTSVITTATAISKQKLPRIESYKAEVQNSASIDLEWIAYKGKYSHEKTKIFAACFCTNWGERIILHISKYANCSNPEKELIKDVLFYLSQFPLTFGWYTTGAAVYDSSDLRIKGRDSDFFILHQRCLLYGLRSPIEVKQSYTRLADTNKKHIDLVKVFDKTIIQEGVFEGKYRTTDLNTVSLELLGLGKYASLNAAAVDITTLSVEEQERYVRRDAELTMLVAQYNNCLALRIMKIFAGYAEMDYYKVCHTNVSTWYANRYKKMLESGECTITCTPNYRLPKEPISGGHHTTPICRFFIDTKIYELDIKGQYPNIVKHNNFSFDTLNCTCCKYNSKAQLKQETIDTINERLQENKIPRRVDKYWVCQKRKGAFPKVLDQVLSNRDRYLALLHLERAKSNPDLKLIEEYQTHQLGAKLFANAGFGIFGNEYFEFTNYAVAECITGEGRRIHKEMESKGQREPYNFKIVFGFTDSTFFTNIRDEQHVQNFIKDCKDSLSFTVELKNIFVNSIFYGKKNRFVGWTGLEKDEPIIKGLDGQSTSNSLWVQKWFKHIVIEIVKHPEKRFETIPRMLMKAFSDLDNGNFNPELDMKYTQRLKKYQHEYEEHVRTGVLARILDKDKGDMVYWYETVMIDERVSSKKLKIKNSYSTKPENLNIEKYKGLLLSKLNNTLEIAGFNIDDLKLLLFDNTMQIPLE
jgi:DNA polymerase elongation subunit (family B)